MSLAAKRGNIRSAITKLITKLHDIDHNADISDEEKIFELTAKLGSLQSKDAEARKYDDSSDQKEPATTHNRPFPPNSHSEETLPRPKPSTYQLEKAPHCQLCQGAHFVKSCTTFVTSDVRKAQAKKLNLCFNCLSDRHRVEVCTSSFRCRASGCGEQHHSALHSD